MESVEDVIVGMVAVDCLVGTAVFDGLMQITPATSMWSTMVVLLAERKSL